MFSTIGPIQTSKYEEYYPILSLNEYTLDSWKAVRYHSALFLSLNRRLKVHLVNMNFAFSEQLLCKDIENKITAKITPEK